MENYNHIGKTKKVSLNYIGSFLFLLHESRNYPSNFNGINLYDFKNIEKLTVNYLVKEYAKFSISEQFRIKESIRYGLNFWTEAQFEEELSHLEIFVEIPNGMKVKWLLSEIWKIMFPNEDFHLDNKNGYEEITY